MDLMTSLTAATLLITILAGILKFSHNFATLSTKMDAQAEKTTEQISEVKADIQLIRSEHDRSVVSMMAHIDGLQARFNVHIEGHIRLSDIQDLKTECSKLGAELKGHRDIVHGLNNTFNALVLTMQNQQKFFPPK